jgi:uncharacterized protein YndB with AHSA1/START domain
MTLTKSRPAEDTSAREIVLSREFEAPRELVWQAMTDPQHVVRWWGPRGFTTSTEEMDVRPGGHWKHTMRGPDGTEYPNHSVFQEVVPPERIVFKHGGHRKGGPGANFVSTWTFEALAATRTRVTIRMLFLSAEERDRVAKEFGAIEGGKQTLARLGEHLNYMGPDAKPFTLTREFNVPRDLMFKLWTERDHLLRWWGPKGVTVTYCQNDLRPGGTLHYCMRLPDGSDMWGKWQYRDIVPSERLVWVNSFSNPQGEIVHYPKMSDWPLELLTTVTFAGQAGKTTVTIHQVPFNPTPAEKEVFVRGQASMRMGWGGSLDGLGEYAANPAPQPERELVSTRVIKASRAAAFEAFADPKRLAQWWGPKGFTNTIHQFELKPGGRWRITLHGPDGKNYDNEKTFLEVAPAQRVSFAHHQPTHNFAMTMEFADEAGGTRVTWRMLFESAADLAQIRSLIVNANEENFDRLEAHLAQTTPAAGSTADREIVQTRVFDAPPELVWRAWTDPKHMAAWFGPKGFTTTVQEMEVKPGGRTRFIMHAPDGTDYDNRMIYEEVVPPERLVYAHGSDKDNDPEAFHVTVTFENVGGKTKLTMRSVLPTIEQFERVKSFGAIELGQQTLEKLAEHLRKM